MAPHLTDAELDWLQALGQKGQTPNQIHAMLQRRREAKGLDAPDITNGPSRVVVLSSRRYVYGRYGPVARCVSQLGS